MFFIVKPAWFVLPLGKPLSIHHAGHVHTGIGSVAKSLAQLNKSRGFLTLNAKWKWCGSACDAKLVHGS